MENYFLSKGKNSDLKSRLYAANLRAQALAELEKSYQLKSRQILGMRWNCNIFIFEKKIKCIGRYLCLPLLS